MIVPLLAAIGQTLMGLLLAVTAVFMILLILVQRGRGGGLAGALGGMGGSSAFGAKAGDVFTKVTVGTSAVWIALCIFASHMGSSGSSRITDAAGGSPSTMNAPAGEEGDAASPPAGGEEAGDDAPAAGEPAGEEAAAEPAADEEPSE